jgi:hypothetical protein
VPTHQTSLSSPRQTGETINTNQADQADDQKDLDALIGFFARCLRLADIEEVHLCGDRRTRTASY